MTQPYERYRKTASEGTIAVHGATPNEWPSRLLLIVFQASIQVAQ